MGFAPPAEPSIARKVDPMPKQKTHKAMKKRFSVTASGKVKHRKANRGHKLQGKASDRKRNLRSAGVLTGANATRIIDALRPSL